jgi:PilZ domain
VTTPPVRVERRVGQRFSFLLPVSLRECSGETQGAGFTQDLSSRGVFLFTDAPLAEGTEVELTLRMPSEITLGESMRVRCRGRVLRVVKPIASPVQSSASRDSSVPRLGVAVRFDNYEYLTDLVQASVSTARAAALHRQEEETRPIEPAGTRVARG